LRSKRLDGDHEAQITALRLRSLPMGFAFWNLRSLAQQGG
jgi:hypothetical protein